eukprot:CAMPEP_0174377936 /NCGR_PEP_ID=MMETSP0811_2-20130205/121738_1 /TAXON_ID=73025 ORGANISM="Eutreptiella gymnastica-like, Strain CCMP1594" /NCGR_SAMPLE_ID=MMETSP0811_2 /ASSEMBLY_ACC=CAM_ASM_000667 /LENGTH=118 /DNA_ID=CAMNT_0015530041 /DNA_START=407 /DNA_END=763 /DNA_ORIENTATION=-
MTDKEAGAPRGTAEKCAVGAWGCFDAQDKLQSYPNCAVQQLKSFEPAEPGVAPRLGEHLFGCEVGSAWRGGGALRISTEQARTEGLSTSSAGPSTCFAFPVHGITGFAQVGVLCVGDV